MTIVNSVRNWLRIKLCGEELLELANLKRKVSDMKVWCSHIPVARECGRWLEDSKSYPSQCRGSHGSIEDFRVYLEFESLKLNSRKSYTEGGRASGRTFRLLIGAVLRCLEASPNNPSTIYVIGIDGNHCWNLNSVAMGIVKNIIGKQDNQGEILMPNRSRLLFATKCWLDSRKKFNGVTINDDDVFEDHYTQECRHGR